jgi:hypothetical protein
MSRHRCRGFVLIFFRLLGKVMGVPRGFGSADAVLKPILRRSWASPGGGLGVVLGGLWWSEGGLGRSWGLVGPGLSHLEAISGRLGRALKRHRVALAPSDAKRTILRRRKPHFSPLVLQVSHGFEAHLKACVAASAQSGCIKKIQKNTWFCT